MDKYKAKKKFGQNFLKDKGVLIKIIDSIDVKEDDLVIEIGPGKGYLTKYLKLFKANLLCYEIDQDLKKYLADYEDEKTKIIYKDFLNSNISDDIKNINYNNLYIIANLPYYITTPIIDKIINSDIKPKECVFMVQDEVADRLCANSGNKNYGYISVLLELYYHRSKLFKVSRNSFDPIPNVDSAVIKLVSNNNIDEVKSVDNFKRFVKDAFLMKRKNLRNNLRKYDLEKINHSLSKYNYSLQDRAEDISFKCYIDIVNSIF